MKRHNYNCTVKWTGNIGVGTKDYTSYERAYTISIQNKIDIQGSSDPSFRGDPTKHNPEELFLASISSCHALWYLHLCASNGIVVLSYLDRATGTMLETKQGKGYFSEVTLLPSVIIAKPENLATAKALHQQANEMCFIANSCNFPIHHKPNISV